MNLPRRTVYMLLLALICLNVLVRLPRSEHETGIDSFFIHNLATAVSEQGRLPWVLNPLGYFGWYPLSYPSSAPILISGVAQTSELTEEGAILVLSLVYGLLGALGGFVLARSFRRDDVFAVLVATIFSLAPRFISFTLWSASSRNLFMVLIPIFLWALIRSYRRPLPQNTGLLVSVLVVMLATHRLTILLAVVVIAFIATYIFILLSRVARIRFPRTLLSAQARRWAPGITLLGIGVIAVVMVFGTEVLSEYSEGEVCSGTELPSQLCNLGISITRSVGLALPFALVGVFVVVRERGKGFNESFLVLALLSLIPTLFLRQYTGFYILPFLSVAAAFGVVGVLRLAVKHRRARNALIVACVAGIGGFSLAVLQVEVDRSTSLSDASYSTALYLTTLPDGNFVANEGLVTIRVAAVSGRSGLPVGGAGTTSQSPELLIMGAYNSTTLYERERRIPITELTIENDSPFTLDGVDVRTAWQVDILFKRVDDVTSSTVRQFGLRYYLEDDSLRGVFSAYGNIYRGFPFDEFAKSVHAERYKIYDGSTEDVYLVFGSPTR